MGLWADLRGRSAEDSQNSSNSSISELAFGSDKPFSNHSIGGGGSIVPMLKRPKYRNS